MNRQRLSQIGSALLSLGIFVLCVWAIQNQLRTHPIRDLWADLQDISNRRLLLAIGFTCLNYLTLTGYDALALVYIHHPLPYRRAAFASIVSHGISNGVGLPLFSGSAIRYRLYSAWGLSVGEIAKIIAFCNLSFALGVFAVGGVLFSIEPLAIPELLNIRFASTHSLGAIFLSIFIGYLILCLINKKPLKIANFIIPNIPLKLCLTQIVVTFLDWAIAAAILYVLIPQDRLPSFLAFFSIFLLAEVSGIISNIPAGLGVFEAIILLLLPQTLPAALIAFRFAYHLLPLLVSVLMLGIYELRLRLLSNTIAEVKSPKE
jgi:uncharacterized membrane protein YbhN (UPF0104 family)